MYSNLLLIAVTVLLLVTMGVSALYYGRIRKVREEYEKAASTVSDIVVSFNRQFQKQEEGLHAVARRIDTVSTRNEKAVRKTEEHDKWLVDLRSTIEDVHALEKRLSRHIADLNKKVDDTKSAQDKLTQRIVEVERLKHKAQTPEAKIRAAIPIKKEKALAPLTETELTVLETIAKEGEKTAPEIREKIRLTREHTARLMKKLYGDGYLERDTHKMPYAYRLKEEMQKILKRRESRA